jgi:Rrf2 family protein
MFLSKSCIYAVRSVLYLALHNEGFVSIREIARELEIPFHFLSKIMQSLTEQNLLISERGAKGGVKLASEPSNINVLSIVGAIDGLDVFKECVLGLPNCGFDKPCALHEHMVNIRDNLRKTLHNMTLQDVAEKLKSSDLRITA